MKKTPNAVLKPPIQTPQPQCANPIRPSENHFLEPSQEWEGGPILEGKKPRLFGVKGIGGLRKPHYRGALYGALSGELEAFQNRIIQVG